MNRKFTFKALAVAGVIAVAQLSAQPSFAMGGASGPHVNYGTQGHLGEVIVNPYRIAPLTAVIRNGGYDLSNVTVKVLPKPNGVPIEYKVSDKQLKTHAGIPVFGLYADYNNSVEVSYTRTLRGKSETFKDIYRFYTPAIYTHSTGLPNQVKPFDVKVLKDALIKSA